MRAGADRFAVDDNDQSCTAQPRADRRRKANGPLHDCKSSHRDLGAFRPHERCRLHVAGITSVLVAQSGWNMGEIVICVVDVEVLYKILERTRTRNGLVDTTNLSFTEKRQSFPISPP